MTHHLFRILTGLFLIMLCTLTAVAQDPLLNMYNRDTHEELFIKAVKARVIIEGPLARMTYHFTIGNSAGKPIEVSYNLHVPEDTVLTGFGYYYQHRYIRGEMYDYNEAWKIYSAVTSRGRDPGIMERQSDRDYHAQIFPVEPGHDLRVDITLVQALRADKNGISSVIPLILPTAQDAAIPADVEMVWLQNSGTITSLNYRRLLTRTQQHDNAMLKLQGRMKVTRDWVVRTPRATAGTLLLTYSRMNGKHQGYYAALISPAQRVRKVRVRVEGARLTLPTRQDTIPAYGRAFIVGQYRTAGKATIMLSAKRGWREQAVIRLSSQFERQSPASQIWADKWLALMEQNATPDRNKIIRMSKRYHVVSSYTALLAIPKEELARYRQLEAERKVQTNTRHIGGGGGDPWIRVSAPEDARQVVAVFPDGQGKSLTFDRVHHCWGLRFDFPFGTAAGAYRVTIIVVYRDGRRSQYLLEYANLISSSITASAAALRAHPGQTVLVAVSGAGIGRAVAVTPWGERLVLHGDTPNRWLGRLTVPTTCPHGGQSITLILYDGAHNRTEVTLDLSVE